MDTFPRTWSNWSLWGKCQKLISWRAQGLVCLNKVLKNWVSNSVIGKLLPVSKLNWNTFDFEAKPQALKMSGKGLNCQNLVTVFLSSLTLKVYLNFQEPAIGLKQIELAIQRPLWWWTQCSDLFSVCQDFEKDDIIENPKNYKRGGCSLESVANSLEECSLSVWLNCLCTKMIKKWIIFKK